MKPTSEELALESRVSSAQPTYRFHTADGVHSKGSFRTAELLLMDALWNADLDHLCCLEANYGVVPSVLAGRATGVHATESSARAARLCDRNALENGADVTTAVTADPTTLGERFETVAYAPKPYTPLSMVQQHIADGLAVLESGGRLFLAAAKRTGLARCADCLRDLTSGVERVAERDGFVLLEATRGESFDKPSYVSPRTIRPAVGDVELALVTLPGLFSATELDDGTRLLLETATIEDGERVLDLCCGYGAIGTYAGRVADCEVWLTDDDRVATWCAERSLRASGVAGTVVTADCTAGVADLTFDHVFCNPPTHAGSGVLAELLAGIHDVLVSGGELAMVHHRDLDLRPHLSRFGTVERRRETDEYVVLNATGRCF